MITDDDITMFEMGNHLPDEKEKILSTLNLQFTFSQLKDIFHQSYQRKRLGYMRMMGYTNLDQCRRKYLLEFLVNILKVQNNVVIKIQA